MKKETNNSVSSKILIFWTESKFEVCIIHCSMCTLFSIWCAGGLQKSHKQQQIYFIRLSCHNNNSKKNTKKLENRISYEKCFLVENKVKTSHVDIFAAFFLSYFVLWRILFSCRFLQKHRPQEPRWLPEFICINDFSRFTCGWWLKNCADQILIAQSFAHFMTWNFCIHTENKVIKNT